MDAVKRFIDFFSPACSGTNNKNTVERLLLMTTVDYFPFSFVLLHGFGYLSCFFFLLLSRSSIQSTVWKQIHYYLAKLQSANKPQYYTDNHFVCNVHTVEKRLWLLFWDRCRSWQQTKSSANEYCSVHQNQNPYIWTMHWDRIITDRFLIGINRRFESVVCSITESNGKWNKKVHGKSVFKNRTLHCDDNEHFCCIIWTNVRKEWMKMWIHIVRCHNERQFVVVVPVTMNRKCEITVVI